MNDIRRGGLIVREALKNIPANILSSLCFMLIQSTWTSHFKRIPWFCLLFGPFNFNRLSLTIQTTKQRGLSQTCPVYWKYWSIFVRKKRKEMILFKKNQFSKFQQIKISLIFAILTQNGILQTWSILNHFIFKFFFLILEPFDFFCSIFLIISRFLRESPKNENSLQYH